MRPSRVLYPLLFTCSLESMMHPMARARWLLFSWLAVAAMAGLKTCGACDAPPRRGRIFELKKGDFSVKVTNLGASIVSVVIPDSRGNLADVVLGYEHLCRYERNPNYFGATVGRVANRISNARFVLDGVVHNLVKNEGNNTLHGGPRGFTQVAWDVKEYVGGEFPYVKFYYRSFDGEEGFPGAVDVYVLYRITAAYHLHLSMHAIPVDKPTPVNLAQHAYWNLAGHASGETILSHTLQVSASWFTPVDAESLPTGAFAHVDDTPYDFRRPRPIGSRIGQLPGGGYDINYVLDRTGAAKRSLRRAAVLADAGSGRTMEVWTDQRGMQLYTANRLAEWRGKDGSVYGTHAGVCLETQAFPDAVNHRRFPPVIVRPGEEYRHEMLLKFGF